MCTKCFTTAIRKIAEVPTEEFFESPPSTAITYNDIFKNKDTPEFILHLVRIQLQKDSQVQRAYYKACYGYLNINIFTDKLKSNMDKILESYIDRITFKQQDDNHIYYSFLYINFDDIDYDYLHQAEYCEFYRKGDV